MFTRKPVWLAASVLFVAPAVHAEDTGTMSEVVVKANRLKAEESSLPSSTNLQGSNLTAQRLMTDDSAHLLDNVPGLSFYSGGGVSSLPVIDGLADDRINILVNGMTITSACPNHMNPALSYIDPASVGSVSVMAGLTPVSLGGDSIGGTISIHSADPVFAKAGEGSRASGSLAAFYRSNGNVSGGNANASLANEKVSIAYSGATVWSRNYKDGNGKEVKSTKYKSQNNLITLATKLGNDLLSIEAGWQDIPYQGFPNQYMDMTGNKSTTLNALYKSTYDWGQFSARAYRHHVRHKMDMLQDKVGPMPMDTEAADSGYALQADILSAENDVVRIGHEFHHYTLNDWWPPIGTGMGPDAFWNINGGQRDRLAVFGEWETKLNPVWSSQLGARFERVTMNTGKVQGYFSTGDAKWGAGIPNGFWYGNDANAFNARDHKRTDNNFDLTAVARYEPGKTGTFDIGFAHKTRSPNLYERFAWSNESMMAGAMNSYVGDLNAYVGNLDLKPEVANSLRANLDWHDAARSDWQLKVEPFYTRVHNYVNVQPNTTPLAVATVVMLAPNVALQYVNHNAELYGLDLSAKKTLGHAAGEWSGKTIVSYVHGKDTTTGGNLYDIMPLNAKFILEHKLGAWNSSIELHAVSDKRSVDAVRKEVTTAGYSLVNLRTGYNWNKVRLDAGIDNLFNKQYALPLGGIDLNQSTVNKALTQVRGMGRSVNVGLTASF